MASVVVRKAVSADMPGVLELIRELARFEKMEEQVRLTADVLKKDGFERSDPLFGCYVAEDASRNLLGFALYFSKYSTWVGHSIYLEDIYVKQDARKCGIGKKMFVKVAEIAQTLGSRLEFSVLSWNPAMEFYKKLGAVNLTESEKWQFMRLGKEELDALCN